MTDTATRKNEIHNRLREIADIRRECEARRAP